MNDSRKIVRIFLASPGDLSDERGVAKAVVDETNTLLAETFGYQIELIGWEDTVSIYGRPQATINRELERCEYFIGLMWKKWGTPPDTRGKYSSGFEEEFDLSMQRRSRESLPEISLFFKEIDAEYLKDPGPDLQKVIKFKEKLTNEKLILYEPFKDIQDFERKIRRCIVKYLTELQTQEIKERPPQTPTSALRNENANPAQIISFPLDSPVGTEGLSFIKEVLFTEGKSNTTQGLSSPDVARLRLLTNIIRVQGNDIEALGVHDANLLYTNRDNYKFGRAELIGLISNSLEHYSDGIAPLWQWIGQVNGFKHSVLQNMSIFSANAKRKVGALAAMQLICASLTDDLVQDRKIYCEYWFDKNKENSVKVAALQYLGECGIPEDLPAILQEAEKNNSQTINAATTAVIRINLRQSKEKAIRALYELQPVSIDQKLLDSIFDAAEAISTEILVQGVGHRNSEVRRTVVELLKDRKSLPPELAQRLLNDEIASVRYAALMSLYETGQSFSDEDAQAILIKKTSASGIGLLGIASTDISGKNFWDEFRKHRLKQHSIKELEALAWDLFFEPDPYLELTRREFKSRGNEMRTCIDDQYKRSFETFMGTMLERFKSTGDLHQKTRSLEDFLRQKLTGLAVDAICKQRDRQDLKRVRVALKSEYVYATESHLEYLQKFGEWDDIPLIIDATKRANPGAIRRTILGSGGDSKITIIAAHTISSLAKNRLSEVLSLPMSGGLKSQVVKEISDSDFRGLGDAVINDLFLSESDTVRKTSALKAIKALPKTRIKNLLASYVRSDRYRYYNVVHWLDFGASAPAGLAKKSATKMLFTE